MPVERYASVGEAAAEWDDLAARVGARPWMRPGWFDCWWRAFGAGELCVLAVRREGRLAGVLPLVRTGRSLGSPANWHSPAFGMLAEDDDARRELAEAAMAERPLRLTGRLLDSEEGGLDVLRAVTRARGYVTSERVEMRSPWIRVAGSFDDYQRDRGPDKKRRKETERRRRRLEEKEGPVALAVSDGTEDLDASLARGFELEASGWKAEEGTAIASDPQLVAFYTDIARWAAREGILRLCFLRAGDREIAFELILDDGRSLYDVKGGFDVAYREFSPGLLVAFELIRHAHELGRESFELLGDAESYKLIWTSDLRDRVQLQAFARTPAGMASYVAQEYARPLAKRVLRR